MWAINVLIHFQGLPDDAGIHMLSVSLYICLFNFYFVLFLFFPAPLAYGSAAAFQFTLVTKLWQLSPTLFCIRRVQDSWVLLKEQNLRYGKTIMPYWGRNKERSAAH